MIRLAIFACLFALAMNSTPLPAFAQEEEKQQQNTVYPLAVLPFQERGKEVESLGGKVSDLLFANLVANPDLYLVDREDLQTILAEQELNQSGLVKSEEAAKLGQLTGAKILVTGSVLQVGEKLYIVAKVMGTETTRVLGTSVKGKLDDDLDGLAEQLAKGISDTVTKRADDLVPKPMKPADRVAALKKAIKGDGRPVLTINVQERHVGQATFDPAAQTELSRLSKEAGFSIIDADAGDESKAEIVLAGEGLSEFAARHGNLVSVKARVELKAVERATGRVLAVDRETVIGVGLAEQIAAKSALEEAAGRIALRLLPKIAGK